MVKKEELKTITKDIVLIIGDVRIAMTITDTSIHPYPEYHLEDALESLAKVFKGVLAYETTERWEPGKEDD